MNAMLATYLMLAPCGDAYSLGYQGPWGDDPAKMAELPHARGLMNDEFIGRRFPRPTVEAAAAIQRRAHAERLARDLMISVRESVGVDALLNRVALDRSGTYSEARGARPPKLATFLAAVEFDPSFGREALGALAARIGCVVVPAGAAAAPRPRLVELLEGLHEELGRLRSASCGPDEEDVLSAAG